MLKLKGKTENMKKEKLQSPTAVILLSLKENLFKELKI